MAENNVPLFEGNIQLNGIKYHIFGQRTGSQVVAGSQFYGTVYTHDGIEYGVFGSPVMPSPHPLPHPPPPQTSAPPSPRSASNTIMEDLQQDMKKKASYEQWTKEQSDLLLELMVDAAARGWRDNNGIFTKVTVEERILPILNSRLGCNKNYSNYQSRLRWFKTRWLSYSNLMRFSSSFGYDYTTKKFTAPDEVWDEYLKAHSKDANLRYGECIDYEDLEIAVGNGVAIGKNSIGLGRETDARTLGDSGNREARVEDFNYDAENKMIPFGSIPPLGSPEVSDVPNRKRREGKRSRAQHEANSSSTSKENITQNDFTEEVTKLNDLSRSL